MDLEVPELVCRDGQYVFEARILELEGIKTVTASIQTQQARVSFRENQLSAEMIKDHLLDFGFTVNGISGNSIAWKRLPVCCRGW